MATKASDNRFSRVKYNQTKYGASSSSNAITWGLEIDWDGDGVFGGTSEANRLVGIQGFRGRTRRLRPDGSGFEVLSVGQYAFVLENYDRRYDAWNTSSPLYPNVAAGKDVRVRVRDLSGSADPYNVFYGIISDIVPFKDSSGNSQVRIVAQDATNFLRSATPSLSVQGYTLDSTVVETYFQMVLDAIGWPRRWGALSITGDSVNGWPYYWCPDGIDAASLFRDMTQHRIGVFFIGADGRPTVRNFADGHTSAMTLTEAVVHKNIVASQLWEDRRSVIRIVLHLLNVAASGAVWTLAGDAPAITAGGSITIFAPYAYNLVPCPVINVLSPVATTDWTTNTAADGSGADATSSCSLSITDYGTRAMITVTNSTAGTVYLVTAQINGQALYSTTPVAVTRPADPSTVTGPREFRLDTLYHQSVATAGAWADYMLTTLSSVLPCLKVTLSGRPSYQFDTELFDTVTANFPTLGLGGTSMWIAGISHESQGNMQDILTTLYLEPYSEP